MRRYGSSAPHSIPSHRKGRYMETIYTLEEAAKHLKVTSRTLYTYIYNGKLKALKIGKEWRIKESALIEFMDGTGGKVSKPNSGNRTGGRKKKTVSSAKQTSETQKPTQP